MRSLGDLVRCEMSKWGERPHWRFTGTWLGEDEHGEWIGFPRGTHNVRPGYESAEPFAFDSEVDCVTLVRPGAGHLATFHAPGIWCDLYVDIVTQVAWDGDVLRAVDLDLDVIRRTDPAGEVFVDDEDEFAEHQVLFGYPPEVVASARAECSAVLAAARAGEAPYDGSHRRWLDVLSSASRASRRA